MGKHLLGYGQRSLCWWVESGDRETKAGRVPQRQETGVSIVAAAQKTAQTPLVWGREPEYRGFQVSVSTGKGKD